jgi:phospholipid/cholesterol/gamma-HCH transport system substrate-binding protein
MKLRLAVILIVATLGFGVALFRMTAFRPGLGGSRVLAVLPRADGIREGATVTYLGLDVGRLEKLWIDDGRLLAELRIHRADAKPRRGDTLHLRLYGLFGDRSLDIVPGPLSAPWLGPGDTLVAVKAPGDPLEAISKALRRGTTIDSGQTPSVAAPPDA